MQAERTHCSCVQKQPFPQQKDGITSCPTHIVKEEEDDYSTYKVTATSVKPLLVPVSIDNASLEMEAYTRASVSIIIEETFNCLWYLTFLHVLLLCTACYRRSIIGHDEKSNVKLLRRPRLC